MHLKIIYPKWPKMKNQQEFHLPPHGPVCFAATVPEDVKVTFCDEHVQPLDEEDRPDAVAISAMLTCQMPRAWAIADRYRSMGIPVLFGGIGTMLHSEETRTHADAVFMGEAEGRFEGVLRDLERGQLKPVYDFLEDPPNIQRLGPARRSLLKRELYNFRGVQMVDLVHASRGCRFNCFPCCTGFLGGRRFRPRDIDCVVQELEGIDNNRLFFVDNSLAQDDPWTKDLFRAIAPLKKKWISHPISDKDDVLDLAAEAGCWYVYQAIVKVSETMRSRIKRLKERGIGVEGTILLGTDEQDVEFIRRLLDFLQECDLDLAEFTVLTPFPHTPIREEIERQGRILHNDWVRYNGEEVVFRPARMTVEELETLHQIAWDSFYANCSRETKMAKLFLKVIEKERADGTYKRIRLSSGRKWVKDRSVP